jgi:flavin-dependent dehydrogenase
MTGPRLFLLLFVISPLYLFPQSLKKHTEVLVVGGGVGGTAAAIQSARLGVKTILVEPTPMLGGMLTAAGVSCTDGNNFLPSGIWEEFREALHAHYKMKWLNTGWVSYTNFEPHVADSIFKAWASKEKNLEVLFGYELTNVEKNGFKISAADFFQRSTNEKLEIRANVFVDATELGDMFAKAGAAYELGMDDPVGSGEKEARQKNNIIQDITWAATLKDYGKMRTRPFRSLQTTIQKNIIAVAPMHLAKPSPGMVINGKC